MTPDKYTINEFFLDVGDGHQLYVHDWGNKKAKTPIIFLHGGPGGQCKDKHKASFNPKQQRVIFYDQRGCGKSLPYGSLEHNTSAELVEDIEKIAKHLKIKSFILTGGSWGSSLALFYGIKYPTRVAGMVLNGIWTCRKEENAWVDQGRFKTFFPEVWEAYQASAPTAHKENPSKYHFARILGEDETAARASAYAYENLEGGVLSLDDRYTPDDFAEFDHYGARLEIHYLTNNAFVPEGYVQKNAHKLTMPIWLVQGRYDMVCPPKTAYELSKLLPHGELIWAIGGHMFEHEGWNIIKLLLMQLTEPTSA